MSLVGWKVEWKNSFRTFRGTVVEQTQICVVVVEELLSEVLNLSIKTKCSKVSTNLPEYLKYWDDPDDPVAPDDILSSLASMCDSIMLKAIQQYRNYIELSKLNIKNILDSMIQRDHLQALVQAVVQVALVVLVVLVVLVRMRMRTK